MRQKSGSSACGPSGKTVTHRRACPARPAMGDLAAAVAPASAALLFGQTRLFSRRAPPPGCSWLGSGATSFYDTSALRATLERLVDFDRINSREIRFSVGAVNVAHRQFRLFRQCDHPHRPEHVMASGALPPGFPAFEIDGEDLLGRRPGLQHAAAIRARIFSAPQPADFQVDLFPRRGPRPDLSARSPSATRTSAFQPHPRRHRHDPARA